MEARVLARLLLLCTAHFASAGWSNHGFLKTRSELISCPLQEQISNTECDRTGSPCFDHALWRRRRVLEEPAAILRCKAESDDTASLVPEADENGMLAGPIPILFDLAKRAFRSFGQKETGEEVSKQAQSEEEKQKIREERDQLMLNSMLFKAAEKGYAMETERLLRRGAQVEELCCALRAPLHDSNAVLQINARNGNDMLRWTALHSAAAFGRVSASKTLLEHGADPNVPDWDHWTPLHYAAYGRTAEHAEIVRELVSHGADLFAATWSGKTPRELAEEYAPPPVAAMLAEAEHGRRRPPRPRMEGGVRADRESFLQQLLDECPLPSPDGPGSVRDEEETKEEEKVTKVVAT